MTSMVSVKETARAAQSAAFAQDGESEEVQQITAAIYDGVDALSASQKRLLMRSALTLAHQSLGEVASGGLDMASAPAYLMLANGLLAVTGYTNEVLREEFGETSTGDSAVTAILEMFHDLVRKSAQERLSPEMKEHAATIVAAVQARVNKGEDFETAMRDEYEKFRREHPREAAEMDEAENRPVAASAGSSATPSEGYGMYL